MQAKRDNESTDDVCTHPKLKGIDKKLVELILSEIMDHGPPIQWDDIAGINVYCLSFFTSIIEDNPSRSAILVPFRIPLFILKGNVSINYNNAYLTPLSLVCLRWLIIPCVTL